MPIFVAHRFGKKAELILRHIDEIAQKPVCRIAAEQDVVLGVVAFFGPVAGRGESGVDEDARAFGEVRAAFVGNEPHGEAPGDAGIAYFFCAAEKESVAAVDEDLGDADPAPALFEYGLGLLFLHGVRSCQSPNVHHRLPSNNFCLIFSHYTATEHNLQLFCKENKEDENCAAGSRILRFGDKIS